jgi:hypothetical protein
VRGNRHGLLPYQDASSEVRNETFTDANGLVPRSKEWFEHLERKIDQVIAGEENVDLRGMPLAVVDSIIGAGSRETNR